ncbi:MAG TPA: helix-hairpin-helix domain-containing protein [Polyangia bacterium]|jgi:competence protein ComEA
MPAARGLTTMVVVLLLLAPAQARAGGKAIDGVVNLNTAPPELLSTLPGVGPSKAQGILAYRARHPFRTVDELVRVKGIGRRMVRAMREHLAVAGPSTAHVVPRGIPPPVVVTPPPRPTPLCRPVPAAPLPSAIARATRIAQNRSIRVDANHCEGPP